MFIKVTNMYDKRSGDPLLINVDKIVSVYEEHEEGGSLRTVIWASEKLSFHVEESIEKVYALIKEATQK
jgi:hypothetical protein